MAVELDQKRYKYISFTNFVDAWLKSPRKIKLHGVEYECRRLSPQLSSTVICESGTVKIRLAEINGRVDAEPFNLPYNVRSESTAVLSARSKGDMKMYAKQIMSLLEGVAPKQAQAASEPAVFKGLRGDLRERLEADKMIPVAGRPGVFDYDGDVDFRDLGLTKIPVQFRTVDGSFYCSRNNLKSLKGSPERVGYDFSCTGNQLTSLEGAPKYVGHSVYCHGNLLASLEGAPAHVGKNFDCGENNLPAGTEKPAGVKGEFFIGNQNRAQAAAETPAQTAMDKLKKLKLNPLKLKPVPGRKGVFDYEGDVNWSWMGLKKIPLRFRNVRGSFFVNNNSLTSLEGSPEKVGHHFNCQQNFTLTSLRGAPEVVGADFNCAHNSLVSLQGSPAKIGGKFDCESNHLTDLTGSPREVGTDFNCSHNRLISLRGAPDKVGRDFYCVRNELPASTKFDGVCARFILGEQSSEIDEYEEAEEVEAAAERKPTPPDADSTLWKMYRELENLVLFVYRGRTFHLVDTEDDGTLIFDVGSGFKIGVAPAGEGKHGSWQSVLELRTEDDDVLHETTRPELKALVQKAASDKDPGKCLLFLYRELMQRRGKLGVVAAVASYLRRSGKTVVVSSDVARIDDLAVALHGVAMHLRMAVSRYRDISGMILDPETAARVREVEDLSVQAIVIVKRARVLGRLPEAAVAEILRYMHRQIQELRELRNVLDKSKIDTCFRLLLQIRDTLTEFGAPERRLHNV